MVRTKIREVFFKQLGTDPEMWSRGETREITAQRDANGQSWPVKKARHVCDVHSATIERKRQAAGNFAPKDGHPKSDQLQQWSSGAILEYLADYNAAIRLSKPPAAPGEGTHLDIWHTDTTKWGNVALEHADGDYLTRYEQLTDQAIKTAIQECGIVGILPYSDTCADDFHRGN